jgi:hypothetical protein
MVGLLFLVVNWQIFFSYRHCQISLCIMRFWFFRGPNYIECILMETQSSEICSHVTENDLFFIRIESKGLRTDFSARPENFTWGPGVQAPLVYYGTAAIFSRFFFQGLQSFLGHVFKSGVGLLLDNSAPDVKIIMHALCNHSSFRPTTQ